MSTGYTADMNITFQGFAMRCARSFTPLVEMRDEPPDTPIPDEIRPSNINLDEIEAAKKRIAKVEKWSNARAEREAKKAFDYEVRSENKDGEKKEETGQACIALLKQAGAWVPPTKDHEELKVFIINQLAERILGCLNTPTMPQRLSGKQYRTQLLNSEHQDIVYHTKEHAEEVRLACKRNEWLRALRHSLDDPKYKE